MSLGLLHITHSDSVSSLLKQTKIEGDVIVYNDVLYEGPTPAGLEPEQWRAVRAQFFADRGWVSYHDFLVYHQRLDEALEK